MNYCTIVNNILRRKFSISSCTFTYPMLKCNYILYVIKVGNTMKIIKKILYKLHIKKPPQSSSIASGVLPKPIKEILNENGLNTDSVIFTFKSDMCGAEAFGDCFVLFDEKGVYTADIQEPELQKQSKKTPPPKPQLLKLTALPIEEIDEIFVEQYLATGQLTYTYNGEYYSLGYFSLGNLAKADTFCKIFNTLKNGEDYEQYLLNVNNHTCQKCGAPVAENMRFCNSCADKSSTLKRLFSFFSDVKWKMLLIILFIIASTILNLILPQFSTQKLYDEVLNPANSLGYDALLKGLFTIVLSIATVKISHQLFTICYDYMIAGILPQVVYSIKLKIFKAMQRLSVGFYTHKQTGSLMECVTRDSNNIYRFFVDGFPYLIANALTVAGIVVIMFKTNIKLTFMVLVSAALILFCYPLFSKMFKKLHHRVWVQNATLTSKVSDNLNGHRIIKAFSKENDELDTFNNISAKVKLAEIDVSNAEATVFPVLSVLLYVLGAFVLGYGGILCVTTNELTIGELLTYVIYLQMLQKPVEFLSWVVNWWARCLDSAQRVFEILDAEPDVKDKENPVILREIRGEIEISELQFEYEPAHPVIKNLSLKINEGEMLGIVGKTGAGKTTISNLIARLYDPKSGIIKIDGYDAKDLSSKQLRRNIGIVSQDIFLFMGTIADNIRYGHPDATNEEVIAAAKAASAHKFISKLPDGYETRVGSGGQDLSGGQRQRISIARTIIQNPKILILDEATASMDTQTERKIQQSLSKLKKGRTTIAIAHRLSTLRDADKLAVIDNGKCIEYGTFDELMTLKGTYYKLFRIQEDALKFIGTKEEKKEESSNE